MERQEYQLEAVDMGNLFHQSLDQCFEAVSYTHLEVYKRQDFSNMFIALDGNKYPTLAAANEVTATINYGSFITQAINFLLMAFVVFMVIKAINKLEKIGKASEAPRAPTEKECPYGKSRCV